MIVYGEGELVRTFLSANQTPLGEEVSREALMSNVGYLLQRWYAGTCLDLVKMKALVPCKVKDELNNYEGEIVEIVFDPLDPEKVNRQFKAAGYEVPKDFNVIAVNRDRTILLWGGLNSVYYLHKNERLEESWESNLAFNDIVGLTRQFKIKNKKVEIDELIEKLKKDAAKVSLENPSK